MPRKVWIRLEGFPLSRICFPGLKFCFCKERNRDDQRILLSSWKKSWGALAREQFTAGCLLPGPRQAPPGPAPRAPPRPHGRPGVPVPRCSRDPNPSFLCPAFPHVLHTPQPQTPPLHHRCYGGGGQGNVSVLLFLSFFLKKTQNKTNTALLYNSHIIQCTFIKGTVQRFFSVFTELYNLDQSHFRTFHHPQKKLHTH